MVRMRLTVLSTRRWCAAPALSSTSVGAHRADDAVAHRTGPRQPHDAGVEVAVEQPLEVAADPRLDDEAFDVGIELRPFLGREDELTVDQIAPPQVAGEVGDLGAGDARHLDVAGPCDAHHLVDDATWVGDVLEQVRADDVVEHLIGEGHVGGIGVEQRAGEAGGGPAGTLDAVLGSRVPIEEHVRPPVRLVAAADVEHERAGTDRHGNAPLVERAELTEECHG